MGQITTWDEFPTIEYVPGVFRQTVSGEKTMLTRIVYRGGVVIPDHFHPAEQLMLVEQGRLWAKVGEEEAEVGSRLAPGHPVGLRPRLPSAVRRGRRLLRGVRADPPRVPHRLQGTGRVARDDPEGPRGHLVPGPGRRRRRSGRRPVALPPRRVAAPSRCRPVTLPPRHVAAYQPRWSCAQDPAGAARQPAPTTLGVARSGPDCDRGRRLPPPRLVDGEESPSARADRHHALQ